MTSYWNSRTAGSGYADDYHMSHHSNQNNTISSDFLKSLDTDTKTLMYSFKKIIEIGCGTGEFLKLLDQHTNPNCKKIGCDISELAINYANQQYSNENIKYKVADLLQNDDSDMKNCDLVICSNTLEHFKNPYTLIEKFKEYGKYCLILVPFNQNPMTDGYSEEGGAGHAFQFVDDSFKNYNVIKEYKFYTSGWTCGINPMQWAIIIKF